MPQSILSGEDMLADPFDLRSSPNPSGGGFDRVEVVEGAPAGIPAVDRVIYRFSGPQVRRHIDLTISNRFKGEGLIDNC